MKTIIITGANSGIGKATALELAKKECKIVIVGKDGEKTDASIKEIKESSHNLSIYVEYCDLSSLQEVRKLASNLSAHYPDWDVLINNAGLELMERTVTSEGLETIITVNYFSPFLLTNLLLQTLPKTKQRRIINTTSMVEKWGKIDFNNLQSEGMYDAEKTYYNSKLALVLFTYELASKYPSDRVTVNCFEPGLVKTNFTRDFKGFARIMSYLMSFFMKTPEEAAKTPVFLALSEEVERKTGKCFSQMKEKRTSTTSHDKRLAQKLWDVTEQIVQL